MRKTNICFGFMALFLHGPFGAEMQLTSDLIQLFRVVGARKSSMVLCGCARFPCARTKGTARHPPDMVAFTL
jgi:hypothetical protein